MGEPPYSREIFPSHVFCSVKIVYSDEGHIQFHSRILLLLWWDQGLQRKLHTPGFLLQTLHISVGTVREHPCVVALFLTTFVIRTIERNTFNVFPIDKLFMSPTVFNMFFWLIFVVALQNSTMNVL
ncbi:hypothetical protein HHI36_006564 [Cryptolaemus montrouzieri]|uniref:Uncharacterized protein n=1 Tax=Cryptolaemus montrouzieri TaxID=559131 RepID=A0ABD2NYA9_9CUCU